MFGFIGKSGSFVKQITGNGKVYASYRAFGLNYSHKASNLIHRNKMSIDSGTGGISQPTFISVSKGGISFSANTGSIFFNSDLATNIIYGGGVLIMELLIDYPMVIIYIVIAHRLL